MKKFFNLLFVAIACCAFTTAPLIGTKVRGVYINGRYLNTTAGSYTFTVPNGVYLLKTIRIYGAGGGGAGGTTGARGGGGACSGAFAESLNVRVFPGQQFTGTIGTPGTGGALSTNGNDATNTTFNGGALTITVGGGGHGISSGGTGCSSVPTASGGDTNTNGTAGGNTGSSTGGSGAAHPKMTLPYIGGDASAGGTSGNPGDPGNVCGGGGAGAGLNGAPGGTGAAACVDVSY